MNYDPSAKLRAYDVQGWQPPTDSSKWGKHVNVGVVTTSAGRALELAKEREPGVRFDSVNSRAVVDVIDPDATLT